MERGARSASILTRVPFHWACDEQRESERDVLSWSNQRLTHFDRNLPRPLQRRVEQFGFARNAAASSFVANVTTVFSVPSFVSARSRSTSLRAHWNKQSRSRFPTSKLPSSPPISLIRIRLPPVDEFGGITYLLAVFSFSSRVAPRAPQSRTFYSSFSFVSFTLFPYILR